MRMICMLSAAAVLAAAPMSGALAQNRNVLNQQGGLVNVNVTNLDLLKNFAKSCRPPRPRGSEPLHRALPQSRFLSQKDFHDPYKCGYRLASTDV